MRRIGRIRTVVATGLLAAQVVAAQAAGEQVIGSVGDFALYVIDEKGSFDRCAAHLDGRAGFLRLAYTRKLVYSLSVPGVKSVKAGTFAVSFDGGPQFVRTATGANPVRAWLFLDDEIVQAFLKAQRTINVAWGGKSYAWDLRSIAMEDMFRAIENCVQTRL